MRDPRALANSKNLSSYRAWEREGQQRSGFFMIIMIFPLLVPVLSVALTLFEHAAKDARAWVALAGVALALYLATGFGLSLFAIRRLNAWKRAHPWEPPPPRSRPSAAL